MSAFGQYEHCKECLCFRCANLKSNLSPTNPAGNRLICGCNDCEGVPEEEACYCGYPTECYRFKEMKESD